jgi:autotransporter-associated beta strand protein
MRHTGWIAFSFLFWVGRVWGANPAMPSIPANVFNVTNYGAAGDGITDNTVALQSAINDANVNGGGIVEIPAGTYLSGPLTLLSSIDLQVDRGAMLQMLPLGVYPGGTTSAQTFIGCNGVHDVEISGFGTIDGQGAAWWAYNSTNSSIVRPMMLNLYSCNRLFIHDITFQNPPYHHCGLRDNGGNITISNLTVNTPYPSPNTDGLNFVGTNSIIENCHISDGDDNIAMGSTGLLNDLLVTNCAFGNGHGVSIGSGITAGLSNLVVVNCTFNGTDYGIRMKSDDGSGALVQNLSYLNLGMTNLKYGAITIYSYYQEVGTPTGITPATAAGETIGAVNSSTPVWRNITISNLNATVGSSGVAGIIWGRTELPVTNVLLSHVNISAAKTFDVYNAQGVQFLDSAINTGGGSTLTLWNAGVTVSNTVPGTSGVTFDGLSTNGYGSALSLANAAGALSKTNLLDHGRVTLQGGTLTVSNNLVLYPTTILNYVLGTSAAVVAVKGNLQLGGTITVTAGPGFTSGTYPLMTYTGALNSSPSILGAVPPEYVYALNTATQGLVSLVVQGATPAPTGLTAFPGNVQVTLEWSAGEGATNYTVLRGTRSGGETNIAGVTANTTYTDTGLVNGVTYYYVVSAAGAYSAGTNSAEVSATPEGASLTWVGSQGGMWDDIAYNWETNGAYAVYADGDNVLFDDYCYTTAVEISGSVAPGSVTFANASVNFTLGSAGGGLTGACGLVKANAGTLSLTGANSYSGGTLVSGGALLANNPTGSATGSGAVTVAGGALGGTGGIAGPVTVADGGVLAPGNPGGTLTISNTLTLGAGDVASFWVRHSPLTNNAVVVAGRWTAGGMLWVTNSGGTALVAGDTFPLFRAATNTGVFTSFILPALPAGLAWNTNTVSQTGTLTVGVVPPVLGAAAWSGSGLVFQGSGGAAGANYYLLSATNLTTPLTNWVRVVTNQFDGNGNFRWTNAAPLGAPARFYRLEAP